MAIKSFKAQLIALFNAVNSSLPQALTEADVDVGVVTELVGGTGNRDSKVTLTAKAESTHFENTLELHYARLSSGIIGPKAVTADLADWDTDEEVLAIFNADVITAEKTEDAFTLAELTISREDGEDGAKIINVSINEGHIKYHPGQAVTYTVTEEIQKTDLSTTNGELNGFTE